MIGLLAVRRRPDRAASTAPLRCTCNGAARNQSAIGGVRDHLSGQLYRYIRIAAHRILYRVPDDPSLSNESVSVVAPRASR